MPTASTRIESASRGRAAARTTRPLGPVVMPTCLTSIFGNLTGLDRTPLTPFALCGCDHINNACTYVRDNCSANIDREQMFNYTYKQRAPVRAAASSAGVDGPSLTPRSRPHFRHICQYAAQRCTTTGTLRGPMSNPARNQSRDGQSALLAKRERRGIVRIEVVPPAEVGGRRGRSANQDIALNTVAINTCPPTPRWAPADADRRHGRAGASIGQALYAAGCCPAMCSRVVGPPGVKVAR